MAKSQRGGKKISYDIYYANVNRGHIARLTVKKSESIESAIKKLPLLASKIKDFIPFPIYDNSGKNVEDYLYVAIDNPFYYEIYEDTASKSRGFYRAVAKNGSSTLVESMDERGVFDVVRDGGGRFLRVV